MSLLLNLLNYSSSMQSEFSLSLPNIESKDNRSRSLCIISDEQENRRSKMSSKSLSKILNEKPQQTIDPKTRILHRISHLLSIKCKKHFYAFFVTLQTPKKKNLYLTPEGELQKISNKKSNTTQNPPQNKEKIQNAKEKRKISNEQRLAVLKKFMQKIEELNKLVLIKEFQQYTKPEFFFLIKNNYLYKDSMQLIVEKLEKCILKLNCFRFIKNLKKMNQYAFKIEILSTLISTIDKKYRKVNPFDQVDIKQNAFSILKAAFHYPKIIVSSQSIESKKVETQETSNNLSSMPNLPERQETSNKSPICNLEQKLQTESIQIKDPLQSLQEKVLNLEKRKFERNQITMLKSHQLKTSVEEQPMMVSENIKTEKSSNFCNKIPKNYLNANFNDGDEQFNTLFTSNAQRNTFSSRFKESKVTPYMSNKFLRSNKKNLHIDLNNSDERGSDFSISSISGITLLKTEKSTSTLINDKSFNFSNGIGTECVNFKNSLVQERESLKDTDKNFIKKKPVNENKPEIEGGVFTKSFLRSNIDSKGKNRQIQQLATDRKYSSNKTSQLQVRQDGPFTEVKPHNRAQQMNWSRPSSNGRDERRIESEMDNSFSNVNMSLFSNQTVYPTRDISGFVTNDQTAKSIASNAHKQPSQKAEKEKSFIKLLSKKDTSMVSKN